MQTCQEVINQLNTRPVEEIGKISKACKEFFKNQEIKWNGVIAYKITVSPQKFSRWFPSEQIRLMGLHDEGHFGIFDAISMEDNVEDRTSYEHKYATMFKGIARFPQIIRLDVKPDQYIITIFFDSDIRVFRVLGEDMFNSIIRTNATRAHANNPNELAINIKHNSPEMCFLEEHRDIALEELFKGASYKITKNG